jgi:CRISPR/Cas system-associated endoribonuclease Cas2
MRLPITEELLWSIYNLTETLDKLHQPFALRTTKEAICPDFYKLKKDWERRIDRRKFSYTIYCLKKKGWIRVPEIEGKKGIILTKAGEERVSKIKYKIISKKKRRDGRCEMVIFDIPEKMRKKRENFRNDLKTLGYRKFQKSIWISPYDVLKETQILIREYSLEKFVRILLIEEIVIK